jgi:hypothetical protein
MPASVSIRWHQSEYEHMMHSETGAVGKFMLRCGKIVEEIAKGHAPVSKDGSHGRPSGYMRDHIRHVLRSDGSNVVCDVICDAKSPDGYPYPLGVEVGTKAHTIRSRGDYPLRTAQGTVLGHEVQHPGTAAHPFLRPALEELGGRI